MKFLSHLTVFAFRNSTYTL